MRLVGWMTAGIVLGALLGALGGLAVVTLLNDNCSSLGDELAGCTRYSVDGVTALGVWIGAGAGFLLGVTVGAMLQVRRENRRQAV